MRGCFSFLLLLLLLLLLYPGPRGAVSLLRYRYDCGDYGMQLLAYPSRGRTVRFKVMDEFGTRFEVANCSICLHWLNTGADGAVIFSSGYEGCHVLVKEDRYVLRVQLEETLLSGVPVASYEVNMTCPQPGDYEILTDGNLGTKQQAGRGNSVHQSQTDVLVPLAQPGLLQHVSQSTLTVSGSQVSSQTHLEQVHPVAQTQPVLHGQGLQGLQPQPGMVHPLTQPQQGLIRPGMQPPAQPGLRHPGGQTQNQPGMVQPGAQNQPGRLRPGLQTQNQPGMVHSGGQNQAGLLLPGVQTQNQPGLHHSGLQTQNQPGLVHPGGQNHQGHLRPGVQTQNQPGLVHPGGQNHQGHIRPGVQTQNQPGLVHPGGQNHPGHLRPGLQTQNQPGLVHPGGQNHQGHLRPGLQTQNQPGLVHPGGQNHQGHLRPGFQTPNQPGLVHPSVHAGAQTQAGFIRIGAQSQNQGGSAGSSLQPHSQTGLLRPGLQSQTGLSHSGSQSGSVRPALQSQAGLVQTTHSRPGLGHPGLQSRPGLIRPGLQAQLQSGLASLLQSTALFYPSAGAGTQLTREQCQVGVGRMPCMAPPGREACLQAGCCYDDMDRTAPCYYGNTATVQCLLEGHFVLVVPRGLATQPYNLDSVRLASSQPGCEPVRVTETFVMFRFPVTECGTTVQVIEDRLIYENQLISTIDVQGSPRGSITRDSTYILQARCIYNASDLLPLRMEVAAPPSSTPMAMFGPLGLQLRIATDETYSSYHPEGDYPLVRVLRDPIYVEVRLLQKTDPNLVLVLHHCWASPSTDPAAEPQWPILVDGCPFAGDNYRTQLVPMGPASPQLPFPSHYQRFVISTFTFVEPPTMAVLEGEVYISCSASVCHLSQPEPCRPSCQLGVPSRARRSLEEGRMAEALGLVTSRGPIVLPKVPKLQRG
ncbi:PREDICTED: zona pellucida sperm-binding protein 1 [Calidris pugnax]|uniref:zona pellucida sperm-binding protein 1 n=1 Tax=Calidris pugnax TaxID=198806 RepID=UPI00071E516A|nr:PREDICTED: zona pellucida sperm-binding protein 1 [Calidris pugnax]